MPGLPNLTLDYVGRRTLARVKSRHHQNCSLLHLPPTLLLHLTPLLGDGDHVQVPALDTATKTLPLDNVWMFGHQLVQISLTPTEGQARSEPLLLPGVGVRIAKCELISLILSVEGESE